MSAPYRGSAPPWAPPYAPYPPPPGWPPPPAAPAGQHVGTPTWALAQGPPEADRRYAPAEGAWRARHSSYAGSDFPRPETGAPPRWTPYRTAETGRPKPWREWYADYLAKGGAPARRTPAPPEHTQSPAAQPSPPRTASPPSRGDLAVLPTPSPPPSAIQQQPARLASPTDFAPLLAAVEQRTTAADPPEPPEDDDAGSASSASGSLSPPFSPAGTPAPAPTPAAASWNASPLDALIPPYTLRVPAQEPAPVVPRGRSMKKSTIEKRRREAFAAELRALAAAVPGAASATQVSVVLRARDYITRLAGREKLLRRLVLERKAKNLGLDLADAPTVEKLLADLEKELETGV